MLDRKELKSAAKAPGPVIIHAITQKGRGYMPAETNPTLFHGVAAFDVASGVPKTNPDAPRSYTQVFGEAITREAEADSRIVAITAAMPQGTGLDVFRDRFENEPGRFYDVGIAEGHAVGLAAGLAMGGTLPVVAIYSTFLQRAYDQILHDVCIQNLHVIFAIDRAGIVGPDGETHQGVFDLSYLTHIPNMTVMSPKNKGELVEMLKFAVSFNSPVAIRYPRDAASRVLKDNTVPVEHGKCEIISKGEKILLISFGCMMDTAYEIYLNLQTGGFKPGLINARFAKPLDQDMLNLIPGYDYCFVLEDNISRGGIGSCILQSLNELGLKHNLLYNFSFPDEFIPQGTRFEIFKKYGMDVESIYNKIKSMIK